MSSGFHWQDARFGEFHTTGPGAAIPVPENRPQLTPQQAAGHTPRSYLGDWHPARHASPSLGQVTPFSRPRR
ncbi:hypothetical protein [Microbispora bryophytorum]|uniref:hypothetical protein n=1 Tax=Microbispora bryophytorum TaxID=1460882 RepID=UPI0033D5752E